MKKILSILLAVFMLAIPNISAFASVDSEPASWDYYISDEDFQKLEHIYAENNMISTFTTGLITVKTLALAIDGSNLVIKGTTKAPDAKKCGFTYIKLQQYKNGSWVDYKVFEDIYNDSTSCSVTKSVAGVKGYKYRVVAVHYAKKSLFSTEKIENQTSTLTL